MVCELHYDCQDCSEADRDSQRQTLHARDLEWTKALFLDDRPAYSPVEAAKVLNEIDKRCDATETAESLGRGQIELASLLCDSDSQVRELKLALRDAALNFHTYRTVLNLGICAISKFSACPDATCVRFRKLSICAPVLPIPPFDPLHEDSTHFCENVKRIVLFPKSSCSCCGGS